MIVIEGGNSKKRRIFFIVTGPLLVLFSACFFILIPKVGIVITYLAIFLSIIIFLRFFVFSLMLGKFRTNRKLTPKRYPSMALVIPCLNELEVLKSTVPTMRKLKNSNQLYFCYVIESCSTDGSFEYMQNVAKEDQRFIVIQKTTPPNGRGGAVAYGLDFIPETEIVAFIDADHTIDQYSMDAVSYSFSKSSPSGAVQGLCLSRNEGESVIASVLAIERYWLELVELGVNSRITGLCYYGGGQGFFKRELLYNAEFRIDTSMILDDIDLSCQFALAGQGIEFRHEIATKSLQPSKISDLLDQRFRWSRGWLDVSQKFFAPILKAENMGLLLKIDMLRFVLFPYLGLFFCISWGAAISLVFFSYSNSDIQIAISIALLWPLTLGILVVASCPKIQHKLSPITIMIGIPLVFIANIFILASAVIEKFLLCKPPHYCKAIKH